MIHYEFRKLIELKDQYETMNDIAQRARDERNLPKATNINELLDKWAKKGTYIFLVYDDNKLIGYTLISDYYEIMRDIYWNDFKVWLYKNGYNKQKIGVRFISYTDPDYWNKGITKEFIYYVSRESEYDYIATFQFPHDAYEEWMKHVFPNIIDTGFKSPNNSGVYLIPKP